MGGRPFLKGHTKQTLEKENCKENTAVAGSEG